MRVIARKTLKDFYERHTDAKAPLEAWFHEAIASEWKIPRDIVVRYPSADILPGNRVVFNIKGNTYRLIVKIHYNTASSLFALSATHVEYDRIDAATV